MENQQKKWIYLCILSLVWGSSFILMKKGLEGVNPIQLGALRIIFTGIFLLIIAFPSLKNIKKRHWKFICFTALAASFFPVFLFAFSVNHIDSAIVSILNCFTPFNTLLLGATFFGFSFKNTQLYGILIGLVGCTILILKGAAINEHQNYWYALFVIVASIGYALNVNMVKRYLYDLKPISIVTGNFLLLLIPATIVLYFTNFFTEFKNTSQEVSSLGYIALLSIFGTGIAKVIYNKLVQISTPIFSSSVTYLIPIVAIFWGGLDGEKLGVVQTLATGIILLGVFLVNKNR